jgi:S1-C subfamily serine protease
MLQLLDELRRLPGAAAPGAVNPPAADAARQAVDFLERLERDQREMRRQAEAFQQRVAEAERRAAEIGAGAAGPALPPRSARLGVRVMEGPDADMVTITDVLPGERAEKLGLRAFDTIRSINGQKVTDADSLRQTLSEAKGPVVVEILRNGESVKLAEKQQQN